MSNQSSLEDLLVDEEALNEELLAGTVGRYVGIGKESGDLIPNKEFTGLNSHRKVVVVLLAQKARFELNLVDAEWLSPTEISELSGIKKGTVYPTVRDLADEGVVRSDDGQYNIPSVKVEQAKEYLAEE